MARVFTSVPFAGGGCVIAPALRGLPFSISAAVGFVALSGAAVLNALVRVSTIREDQAAGMAVAGVGFSWRSTGGRAAGPRAAPWPRLRAARPAA